MLNAAGLPEPSPDIQRRLRAVHPGLFLRFIPHLPESWAICLEWEKADARWAQVQAQEVPADRAHDIVGYLPMGCTADEAPALLERTLRAFPSETAQRAADFVVQGFPEELQEVAAASIEEIARDMTKTRRRRKE